MEESHDWCVLRILELKETGLYPGNLAYRFLANGARRRFLKLFEQWVYDNNLSLDSLPIL